MKNDIKTSILILAGGFGKRLRSVVKENPKPLAPVAGKPFLYWVLKNLERQKAENIILSLHYKADLIIKEVSKMDLKLNIKTIIEPKPMGTGGAIAYAVKKKLLITVSGL